MEFHGEIIQDGPFSVRALVVLDQSGRDRVLCVAKAAWRVPVGELPRLLEREVEVRDLPLRHEETALSSIRLPGDVAPHKPGTDVVLVGHARHPRAFPDARHVDVTLAISSRAELLRKTVRVYGPRRWTDAGDGTLVPSAPEPYVETPLRYEWAVGGGEPRTGTETHRLEDPSLPPEIAQRTRAGFAPIAADWLPRAARCGSTGGEWTTMLAPRAPIDRDPRFYCTAPDDQWLEAPLQGGERVVVSGTTHDAPWTFEVPTLAPAFFTRARGREEPLSTHLDTLILDADERRIELVWRASARLGSSQFGPSGVAVRSRTQPQVALAG